MAVFQNFAFWGIRCPKSHVGFLHPKNELFNEIFISSHVIWMQNFMVNKRQNDKTPCLTSVVSKSQSTFLISIY